MKKFGILAGLLVALVSGGPVFANPINTAPVFNWTGFYVGAHVGYGIFEDRFGGQLSGPLGGVQFGQNWQFSNIVVGVEADFSASGMQTARGFSHIDYFGTARARVGLAIDRVLIYATAGLAYSNLRFAGFNEGGTGLTTGAGVEWMFSSHWSAKFEYLVSEFDIPGIVAFDISTFRFGVNYRF